MRCMLLGYTFEPRSNSPVLGIYSRLSCNHRFIKKKMLPLEKNSLTRQNKIDLSRRSDCGDFKAVLAGCINGITTDLVHGPAIFVRA